MIIDDADNCAYDIFSASEELFEIIFPGDGQDVEFIEDLLKRSDQEILDGFFSELWRNPVRKAKAQGVHGILFYNLTEKRVFYPNKRDKDLDGSARGFSSEEL